MKLQVTGIDHRTAPVAIREKVAVSARKLGSAVRAVRLKVDNGIILSTCNRTEFYSTGSRAEIAEPCLFFFEDRLGMTGNDIARYLYHYHDMAAAEHLFRVTSGLESMIIGEYEVLGQAGRALEAAEKENLVTICLRKLFQAAIHTGRRVREETGISRNAVSVSSIAVDLASRSVKNLSDCKMIVIGTGEAGKLVARIAGERGVFRSVVIGRTLERAEELARELGGSAAGMEDLQRELADTDIVVTCSGAPHYTLDTSQVKRAMMERPGNPMVIIDIAVPRNIEPAVSRIENVFLHNIDDMTELASVHLQQRQGEIALAERVIAEELAIFERWCHAYTVKPLVKALTDQAESIRRCQLERTLRKVTGLDDDARQALDMMTRAIVKKILDAPIQNLKTNGYSNHDMADIVRNLFRLEIQPD